MRKGLFFKIVCLALAISFISLDISWAYPENLKYQANSLAVPSVCQDNPPTENAKQLRDSVFLTAGLAGPIGTIARYLLGDPDDQTVKPIPIRHLEEVVTAELGETAEGIDLSRIALRDGVIRVPYKIDSEEGDVYIALRNADAVKSIPGKDLHMSDKYVVKVLSALDKNSAEAIVNAAKLNAEKSKYLRLFIFGENIFYESMDDFGILPTKCGARINKFIADNKIISIAIDQSGSLKDETAFAFQAMSLVTVLRDDDEGELMRLLSDSMSNYFAEVFEKKPSLGNMRLISWKEEVGNVLTAQPEVVVSVHQPGYQKDVRFFHNKLSRSNIHVFADNLQFVKQQWHNRQRFGDKNIWLTVPVAGNQQDLIRDKEIVPGGSWRQSHWQSLRGLYSKEPYFSEYEPFFNEIYQRDWTKIVDINEVIIRFMAKKMGVKAAFIRASYVNDSGFKKADYVADLVRRVTDNMRGMDSKKIVYLSGKGAQQWIDDSASEGAEDEKRERDKITDRGIGLRFDDFGLEGIAPESKVNPNMPMFGFLAKFGSGGVQGCEDRRRIGLAQKDLTTLVDFLSQSNEKSEGAEWLVLPVGDDVRVAEKCTEIYRFSNEKKLKIILVKNWPKAEVSMRDNAAEDRNASSIRQAMLDGGVNSEDIVIIENTNKIQGAITGTGRVLLVQEPLKVRRSAAVLKRVLKNNKFGAIPAYKLDIRKICTEDSAFRNVAEICIKELRWLQDQLPVDDNRRPTHFLPDAVHDAYGAIFRLMRKTTEELFREMRGYSSREEMLANSGFSNVGMYPDGKGSYRIDNRGMPGIWRCILPEGVQPYNRYVLRVADAASKAIGDKINYDETVDIYFVDKLKTAAGDVAVSEDGAVAVLFDKHSIEVTPEFVQRARDDQEAVLRKLVGDRAKDLPIKKLAQIKNVCEKKDRVKPDILVTQIAMVTKLRSKDYQHYKCSQKTEGISRSLQEMGYDSTYLPIEEDISRENFLKHYARHKQDIVVISIYQIHRRDLEILHEMYAEIKKINPNAFIVVEGASTDMAKQFLAICPEVDMLVRVESDETIPKLAAIKEKNKPLTSTEISNLADSIPGGVFIRSDSLAVISRLNTSNITHNIKLLPPTRYMFDIWYSERGCPRECLFCRRDQGGVQRYVSAESRVEWMLDRLLLEIDPSSPISRDELRNILRQQANSAKTLADDSRVTLAKDAFVGHEKIRILVVSENALVMRQNIIDFAHQAAELGLSKYFIFKIADTDLGTVMSRDEPNIELMEALRSLGVDFLGFGTENPSGTFLRWWHKNQSTERPTGYTTDHILKVNRALIENGFSPTSIRHNLILSFPEARDIDVRNAALLTFVSPQYNSMPFYFGNGWGNNRFDRTFDVAASFLSSIDNAQYAWTFNLESEEQVGSVDLAEYFYVANGTPEYMVRREFRFLRYIDERLPSWIAQYAHPDFATFYRYAQKGFLSRYFNDDDIRAAIAAWQDPSESEEVRALGFILEYYCQQFPRKSALELLFLLKAHMVSLEMLSFVDYREKIDRDKMLPLNMENYGVGKLFARGDELMKPGLFRPAEAIDNFRKAVLSARLVEQISPYCPKDKMNVIVGICLEEAALENKIARIASAVTNSRVLSMISSELSIDAKKRQDIISEGYLKRISYPDLQAFENLRHLYVNEEDEYLFDMVVHRMNENKIEFPDAVQGLCRERMGFSKEEYHLYIKAAKEYMKHRVYYCEGGLISQLRNRDAVRRAGAIEAILSEVKNENDPIIIKNIALLLKDLSMGEGLLQVGAYITSPDVVAKLQKALDLPAGRRVFCFGPRLAIFSYDIHNSQRLRLFKEELEKTAPGIHLDGGQNKIFVSGDWVAFRLEGNNILLKGTSQYEDVVVKAYSQKMRFRDNKELFSTYIGKLAELVDKHRLQIISEIQEFCSTVGDRPYLRAMFLEEEEFLYTLPIVKMTQDHSSMVPLFMARGMGHFYNAWWMLTERLSGKEKVDNTLFVKVGKRLHKGEEESTLVAKAINSFLNDKEARELLSSDVWSRLENVVTALGITDSINEYLKEKWDIKGGIEELKRRRVSRRDAVRMLAGFGIDERFISYFRMARGTYFPNLMRKEKFLSRIDGFPVDEFKHDVEMHNAALRYPLPAEALENLMRGLDMVGGGQHTLLPSQRNTINNYLMMFGDTPVGSRLRGTITHKAAPLLNIILSDTEFARMLNGVDDVQPTVLFVDEATSSATTLYVCELVVKAFNSAVPYETANICQRTEDTQKVLQEYGVVDYVNKNGLWPLEDINEMFHGIFLDMGGRGRKQITYNELIERLWAKQSRATANMGRGDYMAAIENLNAGLDKFISEHDALFGFVDSVPSIRYDPQVIKRAMVKYLIERPDTIRKSMIYDNYYICVGVSEVDYISSYVLRDGLADLAKQFGDNPPISEELRGLYQRFKNADQALELERYMDRQRKMVQDFVMISDAFMHGDLTNRIREYLAGAITFAQLEEAFYAICWKTEMASYMQKTLYEDEYGAPLYSLAKDVHGQYSVQFFTAAGVDAALSNKEEHVSAAAKYSLDQLRKRARCLEGFLHMNKDVQDEQIRSICQIVEEALKEIRQILPKASTPEKRKVSNLFEIVEDYANNRRIEFINKANKLVDISTASDGLKKKIEIRKIDKKETTAYVEYRVKDILALISDTYKERTPVEIASIVEFLKNNIDQLDADSIVASIIILARKAKREGQKLILGLETEWIPGMDETGYGSQHDAINTLLTEIRSVGEILRELGLDNVEIIDGSSQGLAGAILDRADKTKTSLSNVVVMASASTINSDNFASLRSTAEEKRAFLAGVDPSELIKFYEDNKGSPKVVGKQLEIRLMSILSMTVELAAGKVPPNMPIISYYDQIKRMVIFLPKAELMDYDKLEIIYDAQVAALKAA